MSITVTEQYEEDRDPRLSSLQHYIDLADEFNLIDGPAAVDRIDGDECVSLKTHLGGTTFEFDSITNAVRWLAVVTQVAMHVKEQEGVN